jgi:hypothetical protein
VRKYLHEIIENPDTQIEIASTFAYANKYTGGKAVFNNDKYQRFKTQSAEEYIFPQESKYALPMISTGPDIQIFDFSKGKKRNVADKIAQLSGGQVYDGSQAPFKAINHEEIAIVVRIQ